LPAQDPPAQPEPDQLLPDQLEPDQELPDHELPLHELPDQLLPDQELPDQLLPFQSPPDQLAWSASRAAMAPESKGWPEMSCSPLSGTPSRVTRSLPRARSRLPVPFEAAQTCFAAGMSSVRLVVIISSPPPIAWDFPLIESAVVVRNFLTWSGLAVGNFWRTSAAAPETMAADSEVPLPRK